MFEFSENKIINRLIEILLLIVFYPWIKGISHFWLDFDGNFFHQPFILIYCYFVFRKELWFTNKEIKESISFRALLFLLISLIFYTVFCRINAFQFSCFIIPCFLFSLYYFIFNRFPDKNFQFILFILLISLPCPSVIINIITVFLQKTSIFMTELYLTLTGYEIQIINNRIIVSGKELFVGLQCSGINSLMALLPIFVISGFKEKIKKTHASILFLIMVFSVIFFNGLRIAGMFWISPYVEFITAIKYFHEIGPFFFIINLIVFFKIFDRWKYKYEE